MEDDKLFKNKKRMKILFIQFDLEERHPIQIPWWIQQKK